MKSSLGTSKVSRTFLLRFGMTSRSSSNLLILFDDVGAPTVCTVALDEEVQVPLGIV